LPDSAHGAVTFFRMPPVAVSSSVLRAQLVDIARMSGRTGSADAHPHDEYLAQLVPAAVLDYIADHGLYQL
jgi:hypothetical protein